MDSQYAAIIVALLGGTGIAGFFTTLLKWKPEATSVLVDAAEGAVIVQSGVIEDLNRQLVALRQQVTALQDEVHSLSDRLSAAVNERDRLRFERDVLKARLERESSGPSATL